MRSSFADTLIYVRRITLTGYCSIEGSYAANEKLAHDRANGFRNYLDTEYGLASAFRWKCATWARTGTGCDNWWRLPHCPVGQKYWLSSTIRTFSRP